MQSVSHSRVKGILLQASLCLSTRGQSPAPGACLGYAQGRPTLGTFAFGSSCPYINDNQKWKKYTMSPLWLWVISSEASSPLSPEISQWDKWPSCPQWEPDHNAVHTGFFPLSILRRPFLLCNCWNYSQINNVHLNPALGLLLGEHNLRQALFAKTEVQRVSNLYRSK